MSRNEKNIQKNMTPLQNQDLTMGGIVVSVFSVLQALMESISMMARIHDIIFFKEIILSAQ